MSLRKSYRNRATVCSDKKCVTVYGDTAKAVNALVLFTVVTVSAIAIAKALE